ncbi:hypothetical protein D8S82_10525 [Mycobacterium hodleri]|uniref:Uncharacterized protein n=1 Tax=Mycolicibacterium hodleri TaxID=49897 RepID=A0A544W2W8_9MYCO|nr:hypothetical protein [Mycolicibacterium hodleri]TQR86587.1 hypothetical protein D8S82_10525 [Mycolicibacterium hodleri]
MALTKLVNALVMMPKGPRAAGAGAGTWVIVADCVTTDGLCAGFDVTFAVVTADRAVAEVDAGGVTAVVRALGADDTLAMVGRGAALAVVADDVE